MSETTPPTPLPRTNVRKSLFLQRYSEITPVKSKNDRDTSGAGESDPTPVNKIIGAIHAPAGETPLRVGGSYCAKTT